MRFDDVIETERLTLRCISHSEDNDIYEIRSSKTYADIFGWEPYKAITEATQYIERVLDDKTCYLFAIFEKEEEKMIGSICLWKIKICNYEKTCEIGYDLKDDFKGQGFIQEAGRAIIKYALEDLKVQQIVAFPAIDNKRSIKFLEKMGFQLNIENPTYVDKKTGMEHYNYFTNSEMSDFLFLGIFAFM